MSAVRSMTGFARRTVTLASGATLVLTLKSVNHRFLDIATRLGAGMEEFDLPLRNVLKRNMVRGHVDISLAAQRGEETATQVNVEALRAYVENFRGIASELGLEQQPDLSTLLRMPGMTGGDMQAAYTAADIEDVAAACHSAVADLNAMRADEGASLVKELRGWLKKILGEVDAAERMRAHVRQALFERIRARVSELVAGAANDARLLQEAALLADRGDIEEETARLRAHVAQFEQMLTDGGECGKKLDFLLQEMNREANTLSSKTSGIAGDGLEITTAGLNLKAAIEKCREQVQNLE